MMGNACVRRALLLIVMLFVLFCKLGWICIGGGPTLDESALF